VILSSVRTEKPGFLKSEPRMNVALTRCRKGMVVVTNKCFLQGVGKSTLLGKLNRAWSQHRDSWIDWKAMLNDSEPVELPGVLSLPPPLQLPQRALKGLKVDSAVQTSDIE
jgi:AAA domain